ncbi:MAG: hypothetical protein HOP34_16960 [Methylococcaceae bacterium]|nr:hypothetical protein [Methylococcaceae bacterium]
MKKSQQKFYLPFALLGATLFSSTAHATLVGSLEELNPTPTTYTLGTDFNPITDNGFASLGDVSGLLQAVDAIGATSGCEAADFSGFTAGNIALLKRGSCSFSIKVNNATAAGAIGALIFNNVAGLNSIVLTAASNIPVLYLTNALGTSYLTRLGSEAISMRMEVSNFTAPVPEPEALALITAELGLFGYSRRRKAA